MRLERDVVVVLALPDHRRLAGGGVARMSRVRPSTRSEGTDDPKTTAVPSLVTTVEQVVGVRHDRDRESVRLEERADGRRRRRRVPRARPGVRRGAA